MAHQGSLADNRVRSYRFKNGWSQSQLAERAGVSRAEVSAVESGRLVPSVATALALAEGLGCTVEELFGRCRTAVGEAAWAWEPAGEPCRYWRAQVGERTLLFPVETKVLGVGLHDGVFADGRPTERAQSDPEDTLVLACCDPAAGMLATEYGRQTGFRMIVLVRSSGQALELLRRGLVHVAGMHLSTADYPQRNSERAQKVLNTPHTLLPVARWREGIVLGPGFECRSVRGVLGTRLRWVGREPGSGARQCLDELLPERRAPRRIAHDHRGVVEAIRNGWADAGVCVQLSSEEAGLRFLPVREESYELFLAADSESDPRVRALVRVLQSSSFRRLLGELPGYDVSEIGELQRMPQSALHARP